MILNAPTLFIRDIYLAYDGVVLFDDLNLTLPANQFSCLLGPSGVGKTTLLRLVAGLVTTSKKQVFRGEIESSNGFPPEHQIAYMAQQDCLLPWATALDNALLGSKLRGEKSKVLRERAKELFAKVGLTHAEKKFPRELSSGMRQRVALVRTLLEDKPVVLMDEPFSALDAITRFELQTLASELLNNRTVLLVTHDPLEALRLADHVYILSGQPASLELAVELKSPAPRDPGEPAFMEYQAALFHKLTAAKENTL